MAESSLESLPDDLILDIIQQFDTARDVANFEAASQRTRCLVRESGWRGFVKNRFPSMKIPPGIPKEWSTIANRLTYLDRCFDKRGLLLTVFEERPRTSGGIRRRGFMGQTVSFQSVLEAQVVPSWQEELLVFGAGEDLMLRRRPLGCETKDVWGELNGRKMGYAAGDGDVTALSILERQNFPEVVVGRANGDLQLLSAQFDQTLGKSSQNLLPLTSKELGYAASARGRSPGHKAISWTAWQPQSQLVASCRSSILTLYNLSNTEEEELKPVALYDALKGGTAGEISLIRNAKFMSSDVIACGLGGSRQPLRWGKITPSGVEFFSAARNSLANKDLELGPGSKLDAVTTVRAIEPVNYMNDNVLLSAWEDGSHRLSDLRTPSTYDALYRDRFQPYQASSSMLVYGAERFLAGLNQTPDIRFFDFRFPKPYFHSTALPCSAKAPVPGRAYLDTPEELPIEKCDYATGQRCTFHAYSIQDGWRPDAIMQVGRSRMERVHGLTKASDLSSSFYSGFRGLYMEMTWQLAEHTNEENKRRTTPNEWRTRGVHEKVSLMETGIGLCGDEVWMEDYTGVPELFFHQDFLSLDFTGYPRVPDWSRLDTAFRSTRRVVPQRVLDRGQGS